MNPAIEPLALEMGVSAEAIRKWRARCAVPHRWRIPLLHKAAAKGAPLTVHDMDWQPPSSEAA